MERRNLKPSRHMREVLRTRRNHFHAAMMLDAMPAESPEDEAAVETRHINMFLANSERWWRTCPDRACRRARACLAPHMLCANTPLLPPEDDAVPQGVEARDKPPAGR
jgi:hypothetical protein